MPIRPRADYKWGKRPHDIITCDKDWDPTSLDCEGNLDNET